MDDNPEIHDRLNVKTATTHNEQLRGPFISYIRVDKLRKINLDQWMRAHFADEDALPIIIFDTTDVINPEGQCGIFLVLVTYSI